MELQCLRYGILINNKIYSGILNLFAVEDADVSVNIKMRAKYENSVISIELINTGEFPLNIQRMIIEIFSSENYKTISTIICPKSPMEEITLEEVSSIKADKPMASHMYEVLLSSESHINKVFGFLSNHGSKNYFENKLIGRKFQITAVCDFVNQTMEPGETLALDSLYIAESQNLFLGINRYLDRIIDKFGKVKNNSFNLGILNIEELNVLFAARSSTYTLKDMACAISSRVENKTLYPIDITTEEGKLYILDKLKSVDKANVLIKNVGAYISLVEKHKLFNPYKELNKLFSRIKSDTDKCLISNDCPLGLAVGNSLLIDKKFSYDAPKVSKRFSFVKRKNKLDYNFFIRMVMRKLGFYYTAPVNVNTKYKELMAFLFGRINKNNSAYLQILNDIDDSYSIIPYVINEEVFSLLINGKENVYMALFNISKETVKFYCDFSSGKSESDIDGVATEMFSNDCYLISEGKLYIRDFKPMGCCLFKKPHSKKEAV
jgi:hypothetical protein